ncbi:hypothetical protein PV08_08213 [Exophiala spinifera]|uniref:Uncharacterized protein n=1 Tax=Exophiala spinifera TaxID=91928 RepID=A0A0D1YDI3_9EURO|nr:uncharacterized protein PV08_08213 [Exophiala spinifera]KIW13026.1 hypothetical protein PV08_08213 [Exophiala spinifera]
MIASTKSELLPYNTSDIVASNYVHERKHVRVAFIGAGIAGIGFAYKARQIENLDFVIYEKNADVGGVWYETRYPGLSCDVPAHGYTYTWARNPDWSRAYASGEEIWKFYKGLARDYGVYEKTRFRHKVVGATWNVENSEWELEVEDLESGTKVTDKVDVLINGGGSLNNWKWPDIQGLHDFKGTLAHTAHWDENIELKDKRVAVIGSGASGVQIVPTIQPVVKKLISFNRSPTWIAAEFAGHLAPEGRNTLFSEEQRKRFREDPEYHLQYRRDVEHGMNVRFPSFYKHSAAQKAARQMVTEAMKKRLNNDPELIKKLVPDFELGCRRATPGHGYLEALTQPNARVVSAGIERIVSNGIVSRDGELHEVDVVIAATGYDTSYIPRFPIIGLDKVNLQDKWRKEGAAAYLSCAVPGFPNYFLVVGPNAPISNGSLVGAMEKEIDFALAFVRKIQTEDITSATVTDEAAAEFDEWKNDFMQGMAWSGSCTSWYKNGTTDGKVIGPWPGSVNHFMEIMKRPRFEDFKYTYRTRNRFRYFGDGRSPVEARGEHLGWYMQ